MNVRLLVVQIIALYCTFFITSIFISCAKYDIIFSAFIFILLSLLPKIIGYYLQAFAEDNVDAEEVTSLVSPTFSSRWGPHCLTFWYYRPGLGTGKISVSFRRNGQDTVQWSAAEDVGKIWHYGQVDVNQKNRFKVCEYI